MTSAANPLPPLSGTKKSFSVKHIRPTEQLQLSKIIHGWWRYREWGLDKHSTLKLIKQAIEVGVTTFDHADIYGNYTCEQGFGEALSVEPSLRKQMQLITKCGIKLLNNKYPERQLKHYNYSSQKIIRSVEQSLKNLQTDYIDILLLHRPSPLLNPEEVAKAFEELQQKGKVRFFGVSNFNPQQFETLDHFCRASLMANQIEVSPYCLDHFENGNLDYCLKGKIIPMAWSPLGGGKVYKKETPQEQRLAQTLTTIAQALEVAYIEQIVYSWLRQHPAGILPIIGTGKIERIQRAVTSKEIKLSTEQWFQIYTASTGKKVP